MLFGTQGSPVVGQLIVSESPRVCFMKVFIIIYLFVVSNTNLMF